jgi:4-hydroxy-tetrahydrodipicolinate reductase
MIRVIVAGAAGRMGRRIISIVSETKGVELGGALEIKGHPGLNQDAGMVAGGGKLGVKIESDLKAIIDRSKKTAVDKPVVIDFTKPQASLEHLRIASKQGVPMVIGTTGFSPRESTELKRMARMIPCVWAPNMSVGVNLLFKLSTEAARILGEDFDVEIIEAHHRRKVDAPSGTALRIGELIAEALNRSFENVGTYGRRGRIGERTKKEIGIQVVRAGDIVGEHTVIFGGEGERLEITHRAQSRDNFARGSVRAAQWLVKRKKGLYDMMDVLGLK